MDPETHMGALLYCARDKALYFKDIKGFPGWRALGQVPANLEMAALAFDTPLANVIPEFSRRIKEPRKPLVVDDGSVTELRFADDEVDVKLPAHIAGERDGGRFIASGLIVCRDPDTGVANFQPPSHAIEGPQEAGYHHGAAPSLPHLSEERGEEQADAHLDHDRSPSHVLLRGNGAVSGRMIHFKPNIAQVPKALPHVPYGYECRDLFHVRTGYKLVGADASGLELRCLSHFMAKFDGGEYIKVLLEGDIHTVNQHAAGIPNRDKAKTFIYAFIYGAGTSFSVFS